jgi:hypothetical protein
MRNALLVRSCAALIAVGGSWGTLSEIALAVRTGVPVYAVDGWLLRTPGGGDLPDAAAYHPVGSVDEAVAGALSRLGDR